jgi:hypothetical protein
MVVRRIEQAHLGGLAGFAGFLIPGSLQLEESIQGLLIGPVHPTFVAVEQFELVGIGEGAEGVGELGQRIASGSGSDRLVHPGFFDGPGAMQAPVAGGHVLDHGELDAIEVAEALEVLVDEAVEVFGAFGADDHVFRKEAMAHGVQGGAGFSFGGDRAA